jgi:acyl-CoA thioesterase I
VNDLCVLFFGDSFVAGAGDEQGLGWPGRVAAAAWEADLPLTAYNLGVRGQTSQQVARRVLGEAAERRFPDGDNRIVVAMGANDPKPERLGFPLTTEESVAALESIFDDAATLSIPVFVIGPGPARDVRHDRASRSLSRAFADACGRRGVPYAEVLDALLNDHAWNAGAERRDGIHSDAAGYASYARILIERGFLDWLREKPA